MITMGVRLAPIQNNRVYSRNFLTSLLVLNREDVQNAEVLHYSVLPSPFFEELKSQHEKRKDKGT